MPLKDWVTMIDLWPIVISIPYFQNKLARLPPLSKFKSCVLVDNLESQKATIVSKFAKFPKNFVFQRLKMPKAKKKQFRVKNFQLLFFGFKVSPPYIWKSKMK